MSIVTIPPQPFPPSSGKTGDIAERVTDLETSVSTLTTTKANKTDIAVNFSTTYNYTVGDLVYYNGVLYECTTDHAAGEWVAGDFTATDIDTQINSLKSGLTNYQTQNDINLEVPNRVNLISGLVDAYYEANGSITQSNTRVSTEKIYFIRKGTYTVTSSSSVSGKSVELLVALWASDATDGTNTRTSESGWKTGAYTFTLDNDSYVSVVTRYSDSSTTSKADFSVQLELGSTATAYTPYIPSVESRIEAVESATGLTTVNVSPVSGHGITVDDGGVYRVGDLVIVQIKFTTTDATTDFFYNLPHPKQTGSTTLINLLSGDGTLFNVNASGFLRSASRQAGTYSCTGVYVTDAT